MEVCILAPMSRLPIPILERVMRRIVVNAETGCWEWTGATTLGYGSLGYKDESGRKVSARVHRVVYESVKGKIPAGLVLDHLCKNKPCCNPDHLDPVTNKENILRGVGITAVNATKTHCKHGHEFTEDNTFRIYGFRHCRTCQRRRQREVKRKKKEARQLQKLNP